MKITRIDAFQVRWTPDEKPDAAQRLRAHAHR